MAVINVGIIQFLEKSNSLEKWKLEIKEAFDIEIKHMDKIKYVASGDFCKILHFETYLKEVFPGDPVQPLEENNVDSQDDSISDFSDSYELISKDTFREKFHEIGQWKIGESNVTVMIGNITNCLVDCMVSTAHENLESRTGVAKAIESVAGSVYVDACFENIKIFGCLKSGDCRITGVGNLGCKRVIHAYLKRGTCPQSSVEDMVRLCLETADAYGFNSVAMPALGTGKFYSLSAKHAMTIYPFHYYLSLTLVFLIIRSL